MKQFDNRSAEEIKHYVYCLIDPRTQKPFYIGKGQGNRVFAHARDALENADTTDKLDTIREIVGSGLKVDYLIIRHGMDETMAHAVETALIDFAGRFDLGLTNLVLGHQSSAFGIMTAEEVQRKYRAEPLTSLGERCVMINWSSPGLMDTFSMMKESVFHAENEEPVPCGVQGSDGRAGAHWAQC